MNGPDTQNLTDRTQVECAAQIAAVLAIAEVMSPFMHVTSEVTPAGAAIHIVNDACKQGRLSFLHRALFDPRMNRL